MGAVRGWGRKFALKGMLQVAVAVVLALIAASPASADVGSLEVREYSRDFNVPAEQAEETLEVQDAGSEADIVGQLEDRLGSRYAGIWFDNAKSEFVVPLLPGVGGVGEEFAADDLDSGFRTTAADYSWRALEAAQDEIDAELSSSREAQLAQTSLDPRTNAVVIELAEGVDSGQLARAQSMAANTDVNVEVRQAGGDSFNFSTQACTFRPSTCTTPMRGGVAINPSGASFGVAGCTAGFKAIGNSNGRRYVLTAGHCVPGVSEWQGWIPTEQKKYLGAVASYSFPIHDYAAIDATGTSWDSLWPSQVVYWGHVTEGGPDTPIVNQSNSITGESSSYVGQYVCHSGAVSGTSCGNVVAVGITETDEKTGSIITNLTKFQTICAIAGDSGGPVFTGNTALGLYTGSDAKAEQTPKEEGEFCKRAGFYTEITEDTAALNVTVGSRAPHVTAEAEPLNGNPGWVTVKGTVTAPGATISNKYVNIKLFKWESEKWVLKATPQATVTNNSYELANYAGMGKGQWLAKAIFPAQAPFTESTSNEASEGWFTIKDGYQLVNAYSGKCLDVENSGTANGVNTQQWTCGNPSTAINQVFTVVPVGGGYFQIVARHSNRCADVVNSSQSNGAWVQQWDCLGYENQTWKAVPIVASNGLQYTQFKAKHSSKCLEIGGPSLNNGAKAQQWDCLGASQGNQMWTFKSVEAGLVPTKTTTEVTQALNGEYGWVSIGGNVTAGANAINGVYVNVNFYKNVGGSWQYVSTSQPTVQNTHFEVNNYPVGVGDWKVKVVFPQQGSLGGSESGEPTFTIKKGYQLFNKYSGKCLDVENWGTANGVNLDQWSCGNPATSQNQVFTLEPRGNSYYHLVAKHSGRCLDVINAGTSNGTWIQQWDCYGDEFFNQIWQVVPMAGGYVQFRAKHSGKCLEIGGPNPNNGAKAQQWDCLGESQTNQLWGFMSVSW